MNERFDTDNWQVTFDEKFRPVDVAAQEIQSNDRVIIGGGNSTALPILKNLCKRRKELENVQLVGGLLMFPYQFLQGSFKGSVQYTCLFAGPMERRFLNPKGNVDIVSIQFSKVEEYIENIVRPTMYVVEVSKPNEQGFMSLGQMGTLATHRVATFAEKIIVVINDQIPFLQGEDNLIHIDEVDMVSEFSHPIPFLPINTPSELDQTIAGHILPYVNDGDTIQVGLGGLSDAVAYGLTGKKHLGIHSEMMTNSLLHLVKEGAVDNSAKTIDKGEIIYGFALGSQELLDFLDNNETARVVPLRVLNDPKVIAQHDNFVSINACLACDLTGQIAAEGIGHRQISCTGGQLDFVRGAALAKNGRSFLALSSTFEDKEGTLKSRIMLSLPEGTPVTTPRTDVMYVVTEYGVADLYNRSLRERAEALIAIAHPDFREELMQQAREVGLLK